MLTTVVLLFGTTQEDLKILKGKNLKILIGMFGMYRLLAT